MKVIKSVVVLWFLAASVATPAVADDITDSIKEALDQYKKGEYAAAAGSLDYAAQLIRQKKGEGLQALLPDALPGWKAEEATSAAMGGAMLGGGVSAERSYRKGDSSVTVTIVTDSPLLSSMMMLFTNPMFAASSGGKLEKVAGQKAIVEFDGSDKSGKVTIVVANRFLVTVEGRDVVKKDLAGYAGKIDFKKLAALP